MKKILFIAPALMALLLCGCAEKKNDSEPAVTTAAPNNYTAQPSDATVTGEVVSITGNEVTLALGNLSKREEKAPPEMNKGEMPQMPDGENPDLGGDIPSFKDGEKPDFGSEKPDFKNGEKSDFDGDMPDFKNGEKPDFGGDMPDFKNGEKPEFGDGERGGGRERRKSGASVEKTGEEASYIIPVGMTITGLSGRSVDYSGITVGTVLTLTINADGIVCAASIE